MSEFRDPNAAGICMLTIDPRRHGFGVGSSLAARCTGLARSQGRQRVVLHSTPVLTVARGIYENLGFIRSPELDEWIREGNHAEEPLHLMSFTLEI
jgi:ribosomal protein S18 acetylase RimI-like enzyme